MRDDRFGVRRVLAVLATLGVALTLFVASAPEASAGGGGCYGEYDLCIINRGGRATTPVCIETDLVQAQNPSLKTSNIFRDNDTVYLIISSGPTCEFNCYNGWDINCDGKLGDFCPSGLNLNLVGDVGKCLASIGTSPTTYAG